MVINISLEEDCVFFFWPRYRLISCNNWRQISQKSLELMGLAKDDSLSNFVCSCSVVESQRRCQNLTNAFGGTSTLGIEWAIMMTMQPSLTKMKKGNSLRASSPREVRSKTRCGSKVQGKKVRALRFLHPPQLRRSLTHLLATRNGEAALSPQHFLVIVCVWYSVSQFTLRIPWKNSSTSPFSPNSTNT